MITLGIETSCDETAICLLETRGKDVSKDIEYRILGNQLHSQIDKHREFGGIVPMLAKREHIKNLPIIYEKVLEHGPSAVKILPKEEISNYLMNRPSPQGIVAFLGAGDIGELADEFANRFKNAVKA